MAEKSQGTALNEPERLGKYLIQGILGEGGMGVVYKGYDPQLARPVAIKTIRKSLLKGKAGQELKARFNREAKAEGSLFHPNIVAVYEYQEDIDGMPFFVMEFVDGKTLKEFLSRGMHFNLDMALHIIEQVLCGLAYSHKQGVIHRDIKPANILWLEDDTIKIADFGIAKTEESEFTRTGQVMGTPQYFSPEQALGLKTDARSDIYSAALVLYELLSGTKPFAGMSVKETNGLTDKHFEKLDIREPEIFVLFKRMMNRALEKDPNKRFQNAEAFLTAIGEITSLSKATQKAQLADSGLGARRYWLMGSIVAGGMLMALAFFLGEQSRQLNDSNNAKPQIESKQPERSNPTAGTGSLTPQQQQKMNRLLKSGDLHLRVGRYISPPGSNAYHSYKLALEIEPTNSEARYGMVRVQDMIISQSRRMIEQGQYDGARHQLAMAAQLFPKNQEVQTLQGLVGP